MNFKFILLFFFYILTNPIIREGFVLASVEEQLTFQVVYCINLYKFMKFYFDILDMVWLIYSNLLKN